MNREVVQTSWKQVKAGFQNRWDKLTNDDIELSHGQFASLAAVLEKRYGISKEQAENELDKFIASIDLSRLASVESTKLGSTPDAPPEDAAHITKSTN